MKTDKAYLNTLWQRITKENDQRSFEELFHLCYQRLVRFAVEYVHSHESAEEIVSDIFLKLWAGRDGYTDVLHIEKYLFTAVRNQSLNYLRKFSAYRVVATENPEQLHIAYTHDPYKASEWKELLAKLDEAVEMLPPRRRKIFRLIREEGFKPKEVAEIMNLSHRTVETQLFKAVKTLHVVLQPYLSSRQKSAPAAIDSAALLSLVLVACTV
ncbi:RNA polymerase sigma-70 factor [Chitinophaga cymbidii]|uniref:DNA-directed RNA polymerase sigma-70 factor n=1 Tax=Chitinophaga cymbidii TaxID=1096750 RepID=A0A512RNF7_9BACT|nr:RNA polymerase sigma-70 factor [Chitinophaga cymbidii]GEP97235.1 DNA-directed RNA polymerase sigma-70 factor [Chitinophaga cymbidii]